jgi:hypothetical protein
MRADEARWYTPFHGGARRRIHALYPDIDATVCGFAFEAGTIGNCVLDTADLMRVCPKCISLLDTKPQPLEIK